MTRPAGAVGPLPTLFLTQWVACHSMAPRDGDTAGRLARAAGIAVVRFDRAGTGTSEGPGCDKLDYDTEVRHYRELLQQVARMPEVDPARIVIYGNSLGATTAPLVAEAHPVAGIVVNGGGALTYYERMIQFDRLQLQRKADFDPIAIDREMKRRIRFHRHYLLEKMTPAEIEQAYPDLAGVWASLHGTVKEPPHYGRPYAWHWQAAEQDWLAAWARVHAPVMVVYAEFDQFEGRPGHHAIVDVIERLRPGSTRWLEIPSAGHDLRIYPDALSAFRWEGGVRQPELFIEPVAAWLREVVGGKQGS